MASLKVTVGQITDKGLNPKREANEDRLLVIQKRGLFLVADGVGGRRGGELASQTVVDVFSRVFEQEQTEDLADLIAGTIDLCNQKIFEEAEVNPEYQGMATTLALVAVDDQRAIIAHVGDSRVYRYDQHGLICLTEDHSEVNEALRAGVITEEQAFKHPRRNIINRALGAEVSVMPDIIDVDIDGQTSFLLCSDGITRHLTDEEIARLMRSGRHPQQLCETMKELCYHGGAEDNLTAVVVDFGDREYRDEPTKPTTRIPSPQSAPAVGVATPRTARRIEVDLTGAPPAEGAAAPGARPQARSPLELGADGAGDAKSQNHLSRSSDGGPPENGELSIAMKISLLFAALVGGIILGGSAFWVGPLRATMTSGSATENTTGREESRSLRPMRRCVRPMRVFWRATRPRLASA
jgi:protein phosphatase